MVSQLQAQHIARHFPLKKKCELCPTRPKEIPTHRHHPDYDYPHIFVSLCYECHAWVHKDISKERLLPRFNVYKNPKFCTRSTLCEISENNRDCDKCYFNPPTDEEYYMGL